jgi:hypothetical protein
MTWIRRLFWVAGIYGLVFLPPQYFLERRISGDYPPPITHPEYFYGFVGVTLAWQIAYVLIGTDPVRFRPLMIIAALAKFTFAAAVAALYACGRVPSIICFFAAIDFALGVLFLIAFIPTRQHENRSRPAGTVK